MKQIIPFVKEITFENNISSIISISLEHEEKINEGEVTGNFIISGEYKAHADTTEKTPFTKSLPFTTLLPENIILDSINVDIDNFTYEVKDNSILKVNIDYLVSGEEQVLEVPEEKEEELTRNLDAFLDDIDNEVLELPAIKEEKETLAPQEISIQEESKTVTTENSEATITSTTDDEGFVTYYIHIVTENETIEEIIKKYETNLDNVKTYNDISNIKIGDKIIIPKYLDE